MRFGSIVEDTRSILEFVLFLLSKNYSTVLLLWIMDVKFLSILSVDHMKRSFALDKSEDVRKEIMSLLKPKMETSYDSLKGFRKKTPTTFFPRQPSKISLREHLKTWSHPGESKVQVAHGFDFYLDERKLEEIEERFRDANEVLHRRYGRFGMNIIAELVEGRRQISGAAVALIGDDLFEAAYCMFIIQQNS